ncbi:Lipid phosphate phosphatase 1 [Rhodotorula toruloides]|uniref:Lipid phosphate phosphatase 1 n=1 Tax=Rhodotorula toruloides TaxID=5286 RepID=A0A2T0A334_RHOTO|nr:Lipid phosphate phosphatase 1 [Rhodotorula toruloides]PRQ72428.1 lipid phosphate phosphatase 1 [Rhodotorula toruloides]
MAGLVARIRSNPHLRFLTPSILVDWAVVLILGQATYYVEQIYPYERDPAHYFNDPDLQWPHGGERVPAYPGGLLDQLTWYLPILVIVLVGGLFKRSLHDVHHGILGLSASRAFMRMIVECIKNRVGRLRPDFFSRCQWDAVAHACTGPLALVKDGRRSFPSGHSSTAWQGLFFLSLYLAGKNGAYAFAAPFPRSGPLQSRLLRLTIVLAPLFVAGYIVITRLEDHYHHPTDVLTGSFIGASTAFFTYLTYYPSPVVLSTPPGSEEAEERLRVMERPKRVYGVKEVGDGWEEGERVEQGRVRLGGADGEAVV